MDNFVIVLANGEIENAEELRVRLAAFEPELVIAADGGSRHANLLNLRVEVIIGDQDSLDDALRDRFAADEVRFEFHDSQKDETDLELALLRAKSESPQRIIVIGAMGGRMDMTLANLLLLAHPYLIDQPIEIWHGAQTARIIRPPGSELHGAAGDTLSLIPLGDSAAGITSSNLTYPLANQTLHLGVARGVSNVFNGPKAEIMLREGILMAVHTPKQEVNP